MILRIGQKYYDIEDSKVDQTLDALFMLSKSIEESRFNLTWDKKLMTARLSLYGESVMELS